MTDAAESPAGTLGSGERAVAGDIAARIDRLPLTRIQYGYASITQWFWGIMIAADGLVASLYPFIWAPKGLITSFQFDLILGANIGVGILLGEYIGGFLSDAIGRKKTLILAALVEGAFIWPIALTNKFGWLLLWNLLFALGMGMLLSVLTSFYWIPAHYQWFVYALSAAPIVLCIPLAAAFMPESPRWLEGKGRVDEADKIVSKWEATAERRFGPLPAPNLATHTVVQTERVPATEVFSGKYRGRTLLLFAVWFLGYSGIVYGGASFFPTWAVAHGWSSHELFFYTRILAAPIALIFFFLIAAFGERFERKTWLVVSAVVYSACYLLLFAVPHSIGGQAVLASV